MRRALLALLLLLLVPALAAAQSVGGPYFRNDCSTITTPQADKILCWDQTAGQLKVWNGAAWVAAPAGIPDTGVIVGTYTKVTVNSAGQVTIGATAALSDLVGLLQAVQFPALTGDITTVAGALATTLSNTGVVAGTCGQMVVDAKGRATTCTALNDAAHGGTGVDASAFTGLAKVTAGVWSAYAGSGACAAGDFIQEISALGVKTCGTPAGSGTVTHTAGALTAEAFIFGNGAADVKAVALTGYVKGAGAGAATASATIPTTDLTGALPAANFPALTGDITTSAGSLATALSTTGVGAGTYGQVTVDTKGRVTAGTTVTDMAHGGTDVSSAADDAVLVSNGTIFQAKVLTTCTGANKAITYDAATNTFGCNTISVGTGDVLAAGTLTANAFITGAGGTTVQAVAITGLVKGNGAGAPTAYAGSSCAALNFVNAVDLNGVVTCAVPGGGGNVSAAATLDANQLVAGDGTTTVKKIGSLGTTTTVLHGNAAGLPTWGAVSLTADVSGTLPVASGGTNLTSYAVGDLLYASGATTLSKLAAVALGQMVISQGVTTAPIWSAAGFLSASLRTPLLFGDSTVGGTLTLKSTSGVGATDAIIFQVGNNGATESMRIFTDGRIAIGRTTAPTLGVAKLVINGSMELDPAGGAPALRLMKAGTVHWLFGVGVLDSTNHFDLYSNATASVLARLTTAGNFGLGTTSPTSTLHVIGGAQFGNPVGGNLGSGKINVPGAGGFYKDGVEIGGAPSDGQYVALALHASLSAERVLTMGAGLRMVDAGANAALTISSTAETINVKDSPYNAVCDGSTNDSTALQAAITAALAMPRGSTVVLPPGKCVFATGLLVPVPNVSNPTAGSTITIRGAGMSSSTLKGTTNGMVMVTVKGQAPVTFQDLAFEIPTSGEGLVLTNTNDTNDGNAANYDSHIINVWFQGGAKGFHPKRALPSYVTASKFLHQTTAGIHVENLIDADQGGVYVSNSQFEGGAGCVGDGILATSGFVTLTGSGTICFAAGVHVKPTGPGAISEVILTGNHLVSNATGGAGVWLEASSTQDVGNVLLSNNFINGEQYAVRIDGGGSGNFFTVTMTGNQMRAIRSASASGACLYMRKGRFVRVAAWHCDLAGFAAYTVTDVAGITEFKIDQPSTSNIVAASTTFSGAPMTMFPELFGWATDAPAATNRAALQTTHDVCPVAGCEIVLPAGGANLDSTVVTLSKPVTVRGAGMGATTLTTSATTTVVFLITTTNSVTLRDFGIAHSGTTTAGATIQIDPGGSNNNGASRFIRLYLANCWICLDSVRASEWVLDQSRLASYLSAGVKIQNLAVPDYGGNHIVNTNFSAAGTTPNNVLFNSGGGLHIVGSSFLGAQKSILINSLVTTSVAAITANHIEDFTQTGIEVTATGGSARFDGWSITGNEISSAGTAGSTELIHINSANVARGIISSNALGLTIANLTAVKITAGDQLMIGTNQIGGGLLANQVGVNNIAGNAVCAVGNQYNGLSTKTIGTVNTCD